MIMENCINYCISLKEKLKIQCYYFHKDTRQDDIFLLFKTFSYSMETFSFESKGIHNATIIVSDI